MNAQGSQFMESWPWGPFGSAPPPPPHMANNPCSSFSHHHPFVSGAFPTSFYFTAGETAETMLAQSTNAAQVYENEKATDEDMIERWFQLN